MRFAICPHVVYNRAMIEEEYLRELPPKRQQAIVELTGMIREQYPTAAFTVGPGEDDPRGTYITATVDTDDPDTVTDLTIDRELELQIEQGIPVYVIPIRTPERAAALWRHQQQRPFHHSAVLFSPQRPA